MELVGGHRRGLAVLHITLPLLAVDWGLWPSDGSTGIDVRISNEPAQDLTTLRSRIMRLFYISVLASLVLMGGVAHAATKDPRKCSLGGGTPVSCANRAAAQITRARIDKTGAVATTVICKALAATNLRWKCQANDDQGYGWTSTVTFKGTSSGWRTIATLVRVKQ